MSEFWKIDFCKRYKIICEAVRNLFTQLDNRYEVMAPLQKIMSILKKIPFILGHPVFFNDTLLVETTPQVGFLVRTTYMWKVFQLKDLSVKSLAIIVI